MIYDLFPKFKVVEVNNLTALRMGHVIAQSPARPTNVAVATYGDHKFLENGIIVGLGRDGEIANFDFSKHAQPMLVFTEELIAGPLHGLENFADSFEYEDADGVYATPRCLPLYVGDSFTTNNHSTAAAGTTYSFAYVVNGVLTLQTGANKDTLFKVVESNLPNGKPGYEFTYIGRPIVVEAEPKQE